MQGIYEHGQAMWTSRGVPRLLSRSRRSRSHTRIKRSKSGRLRSQKKEYRSCFENAREYRCSYHTSQ
ncbi:hypothetical protein NY2A_b589R [Paramecium bursaria Chlorella virus NY2A]|uniref:Uncharacterized protein b589R n=1 Tax=Paramecium bursaria Chlorella virus NY2A TaxID=46021 RepID=A7IXB4_PBCVN|nr:hypothetical protein NY2A_b589R [Paramecium bursaria Chlorella virus NY2A]ABT14988.1 hypothetical protein NY2A_b589R [Paramecium bursaria Chlorella virus NY2A]